jgi:hypothetical protein
MEKPIIFYSFLHTGAHVPFRQIDIEPQEKWEEVRYRLERRHGLQTSRNGGGHRHSHYGEGYFVGWLYNPGMSTDQHRRLPILPSTYLCHPEDRVLLACLPLAHDQRPYVPLRYRAGHREVKETAEIAVAPNVLVFRPDMTEEEKLKCLMETVNYETSVASNVQQAFQHHQKRRHTERHASDGKVGSRPPPPSYTCHRCQQGGHWKNECPSLTDPNYMPPRVFKPPTGIPKTMLRMPKTDQEKQSAMRTSTGELVISTCQESIFERYAMKHIPEEEETQEDDYENSDMIE